VTNAEIVIRALKETDSHNMTEIELKKFKNTLTARQTELEGLIRNREAATIETSADALDQIQHAVERELALGTLARESDCLREARAALRRIDRGEFGTCLDCEEDISLKRLAALPWAVRCIACQERADREGAAVESASEPLLAEVA
jgi:DnaK suppressor protein